MAIIQAKEARSITHEHIFSIVANEIDLKRDSFELNGVRILDVGCGNGELIKYLHESLLLSFPSISIQLFGLDVIDSGVQADAYQAKTLTFLNDAVRDVQWKDRVSFISQSQQWPFEPDYFDFVLSNQVLEHVANHVAFFTNQHRVMKNAGIAIHLFPLEEVLWEGHLSLPVVHRIKNWDRLSTWIARLSRLRLGKWKRSGMTLSEYASGHADYMLHYTNYLSEERLFSVSKQVGLRTSFAYTGAFYLRKLFKVLGLNYAMQSQRSALLDLFFLPFLKRISSITVFQLKVNTYKRFE